MAARNPARVLPDPVGAQTSVCSPAAIAGQPPVWASVGPSGKRRSNHSLIAGWKQSSPPRAGAAVGVAGKEITDNSASHGSVLRSVMLLGVVGIAGGPSLAGCRACGARGGLTALTLPAREHTPAERY